MTASGLNAPGYNGRFYCEDLNNVVGTHVIYDCFGKVEKVAADGSGSRPTQRSDGNDYIAEVTAYSYCTSLNPLEIFRHQIYCVAGVTKTIRYYMQTTYTSLTSSKIVLTAEYYDGVSGGSRGITTSTQGVSTRSSQSDWSQYLEVTFTPAYDGFVELILNHMGYESGAYLWVDPLPVVS